MCKAYYISVKSIGKVRSCLWLVLNKPLGAAALRENMFSRARALFYKMAWHDDVRFKKRAVIEFPVAEKGCCCPTSIQSRS